MTTISPWCRWKRPVSILAGTLLWVLGVPAAVRAQCPAGTVPSSPTSHVCVLDIGSVLCPAGTREAFPGSNTCLLDWTVIPQYDEPMIIPPVMPSSGTVDGADYYEIAVRQFSQQILPAGPPGNYPATTVWSYGSVTDPATFNYPAFTIEAVAGQPARVKWINDLVDPSGAYLPHLLGDAVDQTLHWANPPAVGCKDGSNMTDCQGTDPSPYHGPVPLVTHLHGAHVGPESDGYPEAWFLPDANNLPAGYATRGGRFSQYDTKNTTPGSAVYQYPNDQRASTLWYHDHTLGMTRLNVYAGPAGFWLIRDGNTDVLSGTLPGPAPAAGDPLWVPAARGAGAPPFREIPIVIQDRSFNPDGSLFYPDNRAFFEGVSAADLQIPFVPTSDISPFWNPEAFFRVMLANGRTWPYQNVEPVQYRFRLLNGCNSRFLNLALRVVSSSDPALVGTELPFYVIGSEGGLLPKVVKVRSGFATVLPGDGTEPLPAAETPASDPAKALLLGLAERADVIVDFSALPDATVVRMINNGSDTPFGGFPIALADQVDPATTGEVMEFVVVPLATADASTPAASLQLKPVASAVSMVMRQVSLNELDSAQVCVNVDLAGNYLVPIIHDAAATPPACDADSAPFGPKEAALGILTVDAGNVTGGIHLEWMAAPTETPALGSTETWEIWNFTEDAHPIHLHLVNFETVDREDFVFNDVTGTYQLSGAPIAPEPWESGWKDTTIAYPGTVTRIRATFDRAGRYVWHCHIVEHEDNEMMRPYEVFAPRHFGVFRNGAWYLDRDGDGGWDGCATDGCYPAFGLPGDQAFAGDWTGSGITRVGVFSSGKWYLDLNGNGAWDGCATDGCYPAFGLPGDQPVPGDWTGTGAARAGVFRSGKWYLDLNGNGAWDGCATDGCYPAFGLPGDQPVAGDWTGSGTAKIGVFRNGKWYLDLNGNGAWDGCATDGCYPAFGLPGDRAVAGDWTGSGVARVGVFRNGKWYLDLDGNGAWSGCATDGCFSSFGLTGDLPVTGNW